MSKTEDTTTDEKEAPDGPILDLSDAAVKKMIKAAKKRGYVTMDELNSVLPSEEVTSEQIEDTMAMLSDMGINVVEDEEAEDAAAGDDAEVIALLSFGVVRSEWRHDEPIPEGWTAVRLEDGTLAYARAGELRSPIDYRAIFMRRGGRWWMSTFIAGD